MGSGRTGHLLAPGSREFPKGPLRQLLVPLEGKGGPLEGKEVQRAGDLKAEVLGSTAPPPAPRCEPALPRVCEAGAVGAVLSGPAPPPGE